MRFSNSRAIVMAVLLSAALVAGAPAQLLSPTSQPAGVVVDAHASADSFENHALGSNGPTTAGGAATNPSIGLSSHSIGFDLGRMAFALGIVLALIFGARWLLTHFFVAARAPATSRAIKVLGRTSLAPRQQILLLQVGRRVVVLGESNGQLSTLAQLEDPDEVAALVGQLHEEQIHRSSSFGGLFGRMQKRFNADEEDEHSASEPTESEYSVSGPSIEPATDAQAKSELAGLVDKVRAIRDQLGR